MASANEPGFVKVVMEDTYGNQRLCAKYRTDSAINAGKSPDGVLANLTIDKQQRLGLTKIIGTGGYKIRLFLKLDAADGKQAS